MLILEWMMKKQDVRTFEVVSALYTISHCADLMFDEIAEDDLSDSLCSDYRAVRSGISSLIKHIEQYRDAKKETFLSSCED